MKAEPKRAARATRPADPDDLFSASGAYLSDLATKGKGALARRAQAEIDRRAKKRAAKRQGVAA